MTWAARALSPAASPPDAGARPPPSVLSEADAELRAPLSRVDGGLVVAAGGRSVLGETPEVYGAEQMLADQAVRPHIGQARPDRIAW